MSTKLSSIKIADKEKMQLFGNLSTMLAAGIPILEAVLSLLEESEKNLKKILLTLKEDLEAGQVVHQSLAKFPRSFDQVTLNLIKAAEEAGTLEIALKDIREGIQKEMEFGDKIKSALMYPIIVFSLFVAVMLVMLLFVMPRISTVFNRLKADLPLPTKLMIYASDFLINYWYMVILAIIFLIALIAIIMRYKKQGVLSFFYGFPIISDLVRQVDSARFSRNMYLLLNSGLPIVTALELSQEVMNKKEMRELVENSRQMVIGGKRFSEGLHSKKKLMSGMTIKLIEVGERSGTLNQSMKDIAETLDYEVTKNLQKATAMLEPIMLIFVGLVVGGMMMSIIGPIYGLISGVQIR